MSNRVSSALVQPACRPLKEMGVGGRTYDGNLAKKSFPLLLEQGSFRAGGLGQGRWIRYVGGVRSRSHDLKKANTSGWSRITESLGLQLRVAVEYGRVP